MTPWTLQDFLLRLDQWASQEGASPDLRLEVTAWIFSRADDPYQGVRRAPGFDNLWYGQIPHTVHESDQAVMCAYWVHEQSRTVRCDRFGTLRMPI